MPKFHPKITRCQGCSKLESDCSDLPFHSMPVHRTDGLDTVVICTQFQQMNHGASLRQRNYSRKERHD